MEHVGPEERHNDSEVQFKQETNPSTQEIKIQQWVLEVSWSSQFTILSRKSCRVPKTPVETIGMYAWLRFFLWCSGPSCCFGMESSPTARSHMGLHLPWCQMIKKKKRSRPRRRVETFKKTYKISKYIYICIYMYIKIYLNIYQNIIKRTERVDCADAIKHQSQKKKALHLTHDPSTKGQHPRFTMNSVTSWTSTCFVSVSCPVHRSTRPPQCLNESPHHPVPRTLQRPGIPEAFRFWSYKLMQNIVSTYCENIVIVPLQKRQMNKITCIFFFDSFA